MQKNIFNGSNKKNKLYEIIELQLYGPNYSLNFGKINLTSKQVEPLKISLESISHPLIYQPHIKPLSVSNKVYEN